MENNTDHYFAKDIKEKLSPELKEQVHDCDKFMYVAENGGVQIFPLNGGLEQIMETPLIKMTEDEIKYQHLWTLPNMYYPAIDPHHPVEIKTAYFLLKNLANEGIADYCKPIELFDKEKKFIGTAVLYGGR